MRQEVMSEKPETMHATTIAVSNLIQPNLHS
jgi:hypothetical protein